VPEEIRSTPSVSDYVKVRKRVALPHNERPLPGSGLRAAGGRFGPSDMTAITSVGPGMDLTIQMDDGTNGRKSFASGQLADCTIAVHNIGTLDAHNAGVEDCYRRA